MKKSYLLLISNCCLFLAGLAQSSFNADSQIFPGAHLMTRGTGDFLYTLTTGNEQYTDLTDTISINNGEVWDDPDYFIPLEFPFGLNDHLIVSLEFNGEGIRLRSATGNGKYTYIIPFETDLMDRGYGTGTSMSPISYKVDSESWDRIIKIEIKNAGSRNEFIQFGTTNMSINLQVWLYEYTDKVEFRYGENSITDPNVFYADEGAIVGITDFNPTDSSFIHSHFLEGDPALPELGTAGLPLSGTPEEGTVYTFSPITPVQVSVIETHSTSFCAPNGIATAIPEGGIPPFTFHWSTGDTTSTITGLDAGWYIVTVTDHQGDTDTGVAFMTNVNPIHPNVSSTTETDVDALDGTATCSPSGGHPPYLFAWSNGDTTQTALHLAPATYTVTVTDSEGCTGTQSVIVNHFGCLDIYVDVYTTDASCAGVCDAVIEVQAFGGTLPFTYMLSEGSGGPGICSGLYYLTVTDAEGCGEITGPILIVEFSGVHIETGSTKETEPFANDGTAWVVPVEGEPPFFYEWSNGSLDSLITGLEPGTYSVSVTDANGCIASQDVVVDAFGCSAYFESRVDRFSCVDSCTWSIASLLVPHVGPLVYKWSTGENTFYSIQDLCPGTYSLTIVDEGYGDCTYVNVFTIPHTEYVAGVVDEVIHVTDTTAGAISITAIGQNIYEHRWSGPNSYNSWDEDISGLLPGFYAVEIKSHWGCFRIDSIEVKDLTVSTSRLTAMDVSIFPNPAHDQIYINLEDISGFTIQLTSLEGRKMKTWKEERILGVGDIPAGIYLLEGVSADGVFRKELSIIR